MTFTVFGVGAALLLAITNPNQVEYVAWAKQQAIQEVGGGAVATGLIDLFGNSLISGTTVDRNLVFFSIFTTRIVGQSSFTSIGILHNFVALSQTQMQGSPSAMSRDGTAQTQSQSPSYESSTSTDTSSPSEISAESQADSDIDTAAGQVVNDLHNVLQDLNPGPYDSVVKSFNDGLAQEQSDLSNTYRDQQKVKQEAANPDPNNPGQAGADAGTVGADAGTVGADEGSVEAVGGSMDAALASLQSDLQGLTSDEPTLLAAMQSDPSYKPPGMPTQSEIDHTRTKANAVIGKYQKIEQTDISIAKQMEVTANHYSDEASSAADSSN